MENFLYIALINMALGIPVAIYWRFVRNKNTHYVFPATDYIFIMNVWWFVVWLWFVIDSDRKEKSL